MKSDLYTIFDRLDATIGKREGIRWEILRNNVASARRRSLDRELYQQSEFYKSIANSLGDALRGVSDDKRFIMDAAILLKRNFSLWEQIKPYFWPWLNVEHGKAIMLKDMTFVEEVNFLANEISSCPRIYFPQGVNLSHLRRFNAIAYREGNIGYFTTDEDAVLAKMSKMLD